MLTAASDARTPAPSANAMPPPRPLWQPAPPNPPPKSVGGPAEGSAQAERPVEGESHATDDPSKNSQPLAEPSLVAKRFSALESGPEVLLRQISASTSDRNKSLTGMTLGTFGSTTIPPTPLAKQESRRRSSLQVCVCAAVGPRTRPWPCCFAYACWHAKANCACRKGCSSWIRT